MSIPIDVVRSQFATMKAKLEEAQDQLFITRQVLDKLREEHLELQREYERLRKENP